MSEPLVVINNECMPLSEAKVPINDRSFLFGDSLYEVITTYKGMPYFSADHLERLRITAKGLYMELPWTDAELKAQIRTGLDALNTDGMAYVRIVVSRGAGDFNIDTSTVNTPPFCAMIFKPFPDYPAKYHQQGFTVAVPDFRRNHPQTLPPAFKTGNYLNNVLCLHQAKAQGADDALILDINGYVTEMTTSNFFIVKDGDVWTAPLEQGILHGITRKYIIQLAREAGLTVHEKPFDLEAVYAADEAFTTSTTKGAMPVYKVNDRVIHEGFGEINQQLNSRYWEYVEAHLDSY